MHKQKIKIGHSLQDLEDNIVLTLQDQTILDGNQINQKADILENIQKRQIEQATYNAQLRTKLKRVANAATSHLENKNQGLSGLLPHYDDYKFKNKQIEIQEGSLIKFKKPKKLKNVGDDFQQNQVNIDHQYNNNKKINKQNKQKRKQLLNFLNQTAQDNVNQQIDYPKRSAQQIYLQSIQSIRKKKNIQNNIKKDINSINKSIIQQIQNQDNLLLLKSIQRSRKMREIQQKNQKTNNLLEIIKQQQNNQNNDKYVEIQLNPVSFKLTDQKYQKMSYPIEQSTKGTKSMMFVSLPSEKIKRKQQKQDNYLPESFKEITQQELQKMKQQIRFLEDKQLGTGLAATLNYLRENSMLGKQEYVGRNKDKNPDQAINHPDDRVKLQYRNASGKLMKPKQAYRYICAAFHGQGPSKNKIQKRKKRQLLETRMKQMGNQDGKLMQMLQTHQQKTNQPFMTLQFGDKK